MRNPEHHIFFSAGRCGPVPHIQNAVADSLNAHDGAVIHYSCIQGHVFTDGSNVTVAECRQQTWIYDKNITCQRKYIFLGGALDNYIRWSYLYRVFSKYLCLRFSKLHL